MYVIIETEACLEQTRQIKFVLEHFISPSGQPTTSFSGQLVVVDDHVATTQVVSQECGFYEASKQNVCTCI